MAIEVIPRLKGDGYKVILTKRRSSTGRYPKVTRTFDSYDEAREWEQENRERVKDE